MPLKKIFFFGYVLILALVDIRAATCNEAEVCVIKIHENDEVNKTVLSLLCVSDAKKKRCGGKSL